LETVEEGQPAGGVAGKPEPREAGGPHDRRPRIAIRPAIRRGLDLCPGDALTGPVGEPQIAGDDEGVNGDAAQRPSGHLLAGAVGQVTPPLIRQWAVPLPGQDVGPLEELLKHVESPLGMGMGERFDCTRNGYVALR
jgi:hypothetical protein